MYGKLNGTGTAFVFVVVADLLVAAVAKILAACTLDLGLGFLSGDGAIRAGACAGAGVSIAGEDDVLVVAVDGAVADDDDDDDGRVLMTPSIERDGAPSSASASCAGRVVAFAVAFAFFSFSSLSCHVQEHGIFFWVKKCRFP
jgi:hypothetical protein